MNIIAPRYSNPCSQERTRPLDFPKELTQRLVRERNPDLVSTRLGEILTPELLPLVFLVHIHVCRAQDRIHETDTVRFSNFRPSMRFVRDFADDRNTCHIHFEEVDHGDGEGTCEVVYGNRFQAAETMRRHIEVGVMVMVVVGKGFLGWRSAIVRFSIGRGAVVKTAP